MYAGKEAVMQVIRFNQRSEGTLNPGIASNLRVGQKSTLNFPYHLLQRSPQVKGTNPALKKPSNIPEIYAKMFGRFH